MRESSRKYPIRSGNLDIVTSYLGARGYKLVDRNHKEVTTLVYTPHIRNVVLGGNVLAEIRIDGTEPHIEVFTRTRAGRTLRKIVSAFNPDSP